MNQNVNNQNEPKAVSNKNKKRNKDKKRRLKKKIEKLVEVGALSQQDAIELAQHMEGANPDDFRRVNIAPQLQRDLGVSRSEAERLVPQFTASSNDLREHSKMMMDQARELMALRGDFEKFRGQVATNKGPLANVGSQLTGRVARAIRMFVDPEDNDPVPVPGRDPESIMKFKMIPNRSLPLTNGKTRVIATPFGKYQYFTSRSINANAYPAISTIPVNNTTTNTYTFPTWYHHIDSAGDVTNMVVIDGQPNQPMAGTGITTVAYNASPNITYWPSASYVDSTDYVGSNVLLSFQQNVPGGRVTVGGFYSIDGGVTFIALASQTVSIQNPTIQIGGIPAAYLSALNPDPVQCQYIPLSFPPTSSNPDVIYQVVVEFGIVGDNRIVDVLAEVNTGLFLIGGGGPLAYQVSLANGLDSYDCRTFPSLANLAQGGVSGKSSFIAMSLLIGNDSAGLNDNGFIYGSSLTEDLRPPAGTDLDTWISNKTKWSYNGKLKTGGYQIYVPSAAQQANYANQLVTPFLSQSDQQTYNMVWLIDNSVTPNGGAPPNLLQAHVTVIGIYSDAKIDTFVPQSVYPKDPGYELALGYLRHYYNPCCNPDHKSKIADWLGSTFKSVINHGSDIIHTFGPSLIDGSATALKAALPLILNTIGSFA